MGMDRYVAGYQGGKPPSATTTRNLVTPTTSQIATLIKAAQADDPVMAAAIALAFVTGARRGELAALRWSESIDLDTGTVRIARSLTQVGKALTEKSTKNQSRPDRGDRSSDHGPAGTPSGLASQFVKASRIAARRRPLPA